MKYLHLYLLFIFTLCYQYSKSQEVKQELITGEFNSSTLEQFALQIELQVNCHFYIDHALADSLKITLNVQKQTLPRVLELAFKGTGIQYSIDKDNHVFLTKDRKVETTLPTGFFNGDASTPDHTTETSVSDYLAFKDPDVLSSLENKTIEIGSGAMANRNAKGTISGYVYNFKTGEPIPGVLVYTEPPAVGVNTDPFGYFSITLPLGTHVLYVRVLGMKDTKRNVKLLSDGKLNINLNEEVVTLKGVEISSEKGTNIRQVQMGMVKLTAQSVRQIPTLFGEKDILKVVLSLPGVKTVGEASSGFNVRGGSSDQNLILYNNTTIYNPSHLFGFFSAINSDVIKDVELYKSCIPPKYGGRLSSILEMTGRDGNMKKLAGTAGIGLFTSHVSVEGPILKDKTSFLFAARTSYSNWLVKQLPQNSGYENSSASFYDINLNIRHQLNAKNSFYLTSYLSKDHFSLSKDTLFNYEIKNISLKWRHLFTNRFIGVFIAGYDFYASGTAVSTATVDAYKFSFDISQLNFKSDFTYYLSPKNTLNFGLSTLRYQIHPGTYVPNSLQSLVVPDNVQPEQALESALYLNDEFEITNKLSLNAGIRYSVFNFLGPSAIYSYQPGMPRTVLNIADSIVYNKGEVAKTYHGPEYRLSVRYAFRGDVSVKAGYNSLRQYIHMMSNSTSMSPADIWKLSDPNIKPQHGDQYSLGVYKNFMANTIETSVEVYYKNIQDYLDYKSGAILIMNHHIETEVFTTKGKAYGIELMVKKTVGKLNGWISYTYSRTYVKMDDPLAGEIINNGDYYPANYDKPHDFSFIGNYKFTHRYSVSLNVTYSTGRPITMPVGKVYYNGEFRAIYSNRNEYRVPDYFRTDLSFNMDGNHKLKQRIHGSWTFGVYNLTGRNNPYSIYFVTDSKGNIQGYKLSILGAAIPFVTYNIRF